MSALDFFQVFDLISMFAVYVVLDTVIPSLCADKAFEKSIQLTLYVIGGFPLLTYILQVSTGEWIARSEHAWVSIRLIFQILNWMFSTAIGIAQLTSSGDFKDCEKLELKGIIFVAHAAFKVISMIYVLISGKKDRDARENDTYGMRGRGFY